MNPGFESLMAHDTETPARKSGGFVVLSRMRAKLVAHVPGTRCNSELAVKAR